MKFDLTGKRALVTGASGGLGAHFAGVLAQAGASVVIAARRVAALEQLAADLTAKGAQVAVLALDVADISAAQAALAGLGPLDVLVNNAGVTRNGTALALTEADWDEVINTNLKGMFFVAQAAAQGMKAAGTGSIINIASILGLRQAGAVLPYAVSKAGVVQMTKTLALEWARHGIRVNAIAPGYLATDINRDFFATPAGEDLIRRIPQRQLGQPADLDGPLLLLASDASRYMNGSIIVVDGGHLVSTL